MSKNKIKKHKQEVEVVKNKIINIFNEDFQPAIILGDANMQDEEDAILFYNECLNCDNKIDDIFENPVAIKYIFIAKQEIPNDKGEIINGKNTHSAPRMVFFTEDNKGYITFASGIYTALKQIYAIFGDPPYNFKLMFRRIPKGMKQVYTIQLVQEKKEVQKDDDVEEIFS